MAHPQPTPKPQLKRRSNWESRVQRLIEQLHDKPHKYGSNDCIMFLAACVDAATGQDLAVGHRGQYSGPLSAMKHLDDMGFNSPEQLLDSLFDEVAIGYAQRGDIALVPGNGVFGDWNIPALIDGGVALVLGDDGTRQGLFRIPRSEWLKAWKVA